MISIKHRLLLSCILSGAIAPSANAATFTRLPDGFLPSSISGDGQVVAGSQGLQTARWTRQAGVTDLGLLPGSTSNRVSSRGTGSNISYDGSSIVGLSFDPDGSSQAFLWTAEDGIQGLESNNGSTLAFDATSVSGDGSIVAGFGSNDGLTGSFRWTPQDGAVAFHEFAQDEQLSRVTVSGLSRDGTAVAGGSIGGLAFRWSATEGLDPIDPIPGGLAATTGFSISADGSTVVGQSRVAGDSVLEAFRWTKSGGTVGLGTLPGLRSSAVDTNADGSLIIGSLTSNADLSAAGSFIWEPAQGLRDLGSVLADDYALDVAGWQLNFPEGVSDDGSILVGSGIAPDGQLAGWLVDLSEPADSFLDQESFGPTNLSPAFNTRVGLGGGFDRAQTFATGAEGWLSSVELYLKRDEQSSLPLLLDVCSVDESGAPVEGEAGEGVLGSVEIPAALVSLEGDWIDVDLSSLDIFVQEGQRMALVLQSDERLDAGSQEFAWFGSREGDYQAGSAFERNFDGQWTPVLASNSSGSPDFYFRTYLIAIPEPNAALLALVLCGVRLAWGGRRELRAS